MRDVPVAPDPPEADVGGGGVDTAGVPSPSSPAGCVAERRIDVLPADGAVDRVCVETWGTDEAHPVARDCDDTDGAWSRETFAYDEGGCLTNATRRSSWSAPGVAMMRWEAEIDCDARHQPEEERLTAALVREDGTEDAVTEVHVYDNTYDAADRIVRRLEDPEAGRSDDREWTWAWGEAGELVEETFATQGEAWRVEYAYAEGGGLARSVQTWSPSGTAVAERTVEYDLFARPVVAWHDVPDDGDGPETIETWVYAPGSPGAVELRSETVADAPVALTVETRTYTCP